MAYIWVTICAQVLLITSAIAADVMVKPGANTLALAIENSKNGDQLILQDGLYHGGLNLTKSIRIRGQKDTWIRGNNIGSVLTLNAPNIIIENVKISGSGSDHQTIDSGIQMTEKAAGSIVRNSYFEENLYGIDIHGAENSIVENNVIIGRQDRLMNRRGNGVYVWNAPGAKVNNNHIKFGRDGIFVNSSKRNSFIQNRFETMRFAIHYMYANHSEVSNNISIGNHLGFAIMFTSHIKLTNNISVNDRDHGIMLNYANNAIIKGNKVVDGGKKCLFMYNANKNVVEKNRFESCPIGIHFTAGSERNKMEGNSFIGNRTQVKFVGSKNHVWSKNYWSDHSAYDVNGDGFADQVFRPNDTMDHVLWTQPSAKLLLGSPAVQLIKWAQKEFPTLLPGGVIDDKPLMSPTVSGVTISYNKKAVN